MHLKFVKLGETIPISDMLPLLENFGLRVITVHPYELAWPDGGEAWIQDFELEHRDGLVIDIARVEERFKEGVDAAWHGSIENDGFNRLVLLANMPSRDVVVVRLIAKYLLQTGVPFSQAAMERALARNAEITSQLIDLFHTLLIFHPGLALERDGPFSCRPVAVQGDQRSRALRRTFDRQSARGARSRGESREREPHLHAGERNRPLFPSPCALHA